MVQKIYRLFVVNRRSEREIAVLLKPDARVPMQDLVFAHDACNRLGIAKVGMTPLSDAGGTTSPQR